MLHHETPNIPPVFSVELWICILVTRGHENLMPSKLQLDIRAWFWYQKFVLINNWRNHASFNSSQIRGVALAFICLASSDKYAGDCAEVARLVVEDGPIPVGDRKYSAAV
jgi:hypothetical protein